MSKRQIRLNDQNQIRSSIKSFLGKEINIVLHNNMVFFGVLQTATETEITLINMRRKRMVLNLNTINELYIDTQD